MGLVPFLCNSGFLNKNFLTVALVVQDLPLTNHRTRLTILSLWADLQLHKKTATNYQNRSTISSYHAKSPRRIDCFVQKHKAATSVLFHETSATYHTKLSAKGDMTKEVPLLQTVRTIRARSASTAKCHYQEPLSIGLSDLFLRIDNGQIPFDCIQLIKLRCKSGFVAMESRLCRHSNNKPTHSRASAGTKMSLELLVTTKTSQKNWFIRHQKRTCLVYSVRYYKSYL